MASKVTTRPFVDPMPLVVVSVFFSVAMHLAVILAMPHVSLEGMLRTSTEVQVEVLEPLPVESKKEPEPVVPEPPIEPEIPKVKQRAEPKSEVPQEPPLQADPPPPAEETPVRFDGVVLSNEDSSWSATPGSGETRQGPLAKPGLQTGRDRSGIAGGVPDGTGAPSAPVALANLSRRPEPPSLDAVLEQNYPREAKQQGIEGTALVRARVEPDGHIAQIRIAEESAPYGFGNACRRTLTGSRWTPPLDANGRPVATIITYKCEFRVRY